MLGYVISILLLIPLIYLYLKYREKQSLNLEEKNRLQTDVALLKQQKVNLTEDINNLNELSNVAIERYHNSVKDRTQELEDYFSAQRERRQLIMDEDFAQEETERKTNLDLRMQEFTRQAQERVNEADIKAREEIEKLQALQTQITIDVTEQEKRFEALLEPLKQYEKERQDRLFYTIQTPDEYKQDIDFLLTTVAAKVQHPDIINKLVWAEYIKPYIDETFKRVGIESKPGIYKLTNLDNGKCYIGKSTDIKKRITDHFKSSIGFKAIADQAVHHAILETGFWNWSIECIIYCDKEKLGELEKYYIEFFKSQEFGYNKNIGGGG